MCAGGTKLPWDSNYLGGKFTVWDNVGGQLWPAGQDYMEDRHRRDTDDRWWADRPEDVLAVRLLAGGRAERWRR